MAETSDAPFKVVIEADSETAVTFLVRGEDHTLGNALRYILVKNPAVEYCGYSIPHPSEDLMRINLQTYSEPAVAVFKKSIDDLRSMAAHIRSEFNKQREVVAEANNDDRNT